MKKSLEFNLFAREAGHGFEYSGNVSAPSYEAAVAFVLSEGIALDDFFLVQNADLVVSVEKFQGNYDVYVNLECVDSFGSLAEANEFIAEIKKERA